MACPAKMDFFQRFSSLCIRVKTTFYIEIVTQKIDLHINFPSLVFLIEIYSKKIFFFIFQATWICQCDTNLVQNLDSEFKTILGAPADLETWAEWLQSVVNKVLIPSSKESRETFVEPARQFLKNWSFYR